MQKTFYLTTTLPYVNAPLHMGHALELVRADTIARYKKLIGFDVYFNTGTDEHGIKNYEKAKEKNITVEEFVDQGFETFKEQVKMFGISDDAHFIRTTDEKHIKIAQEFWQKVDQNGYIYKKNYQAKYCTGCESEKTDSELVEGKCPEHPGQELRLIDEENYFFRYSQFGDKLLKFYEDHPNFIIPEFRFNEVKNFVRKGLQDFSISRQKEKMPWGIPVPGDESQVMYVWFDALTNYISTLGWGISPLLMEEGVGGGDSLPPPRPSGTPYWSSTPFGHFFKMSQKVLRKLQVFAFSPPQAGGESLFQKYWVNGTPTQYCGKDNTRFQGAMWQAMLMAAGLPNSHQIIINGFITGEGGIRMSKTLGNVVDPRDIVQEYGTDALRYFLLREVSSFEDSPFTKERFHEAYNSGLANGLGNLASRILTLSEKYLNTTPSLRPESEHLLDRSGTPFASELQNAQGLATGSHPQSHPLAGGEDSDLPKEFVNHLDNFEIQKATEFVWQKIGELDKLIQETEPFKVIKVEKEKGEDLIKENVKELHLISKMLVPLLPNTASEIQKLIIQNKKPEMPLFIRK